MIDGQTILDAIDMLSNIRGYRMNADDLAEDVVLMAKAWPDDEEFAWAVSSTCTAISGLVGEKVEGSSLVGDLADWKSYHYQHRRGRKVKADMRIVYQRPTAGVLIIRGFGCRHRPEDVL